MTKRNSPTHQASQPAATPRATLPGTACRHTSGTQSKPATSQRWPPRTPWAATTDKVLEAHKVSTEDGLSDDQVTVLREKYGPNELDKEEGTPLWQLVLDQFDDLLVKILLAQLVYPSL